MFKSAVVASEQLKALGVNVKLDVLDWPTMAAKALTSEGWNLATSGFAIQPFVGPYSYLKLFWGPAHVGRVQGDAGPRPGVDEVQHLAEAGRPQGGLGADPAAHGRPGLHPQAGRPGLQARHDPEPRRIQAVPRGAPVLGRVAGVTRPGPGRPPSRLPVEVMSAVGAVCAHR